MINNSNLGMSKPVYFIMVCYFIFILGGCANFSTWMASSGPNRSSVIKSQSTQNESVPTNIEVVDLTDIIARRVIANQRSILFSEELGTNTSVNYVVRPGDVLAVSIWETPPAALFGSANLASATALTAGAAIATTQATNFPEQMVNSDGIINIPFAGLIPASGKTPTQIGIDIAQRLAGKANHPQVLVQITHNMTSNVTIVGDVSSSLRMPLTAKGERLLDALAAAGGIRPSIPFNKITLQITRGGQVSAMPLKAVILDPKQNIMLQPNDIITALYQPLSFTVIGATGKNDELDFEAQGISLAQALARAGGLDNNSADATGIFIFRFEDPQALDLTDKNPIKTLEGKIPVVYRVDLANPSTFFIAQDFPIHNKDILYVANAPASDLQKFLNIVVSVFYPVQSIINLNQSINN